MLTKFMLTFTVTALTAYLYVTPAAVRAENMRKVTRQEKTKALFDIVMPKEKTAMVFEGIFANAQITDESVKMRVNEAFYAEMQKTFLALFDKEFTEQDIDVLFTFFVSETGRKFMASGDAQNAAVMAAMQSGMMVIQEHMMAQAKAAQAAAAAPAVVIDFNELAIGKTDAQMKDAFNAIIQHEGVTVVKYSSLMCEPCKVYAPLFDEVAAELQELTAGNNKIAVKYVALDINVALVIAQEYGIKSVPTTMFFKNGKKVDSKIGGMQKATLRSRIQELA